MKIAGIDIEGHLLNFQSKQTGGLSLKQKAKNILNIVIVDPDASKALIDSARPNQIVVKEEERKELAGLSRVDTAGYDLLTLGAHNEENRLLRLMAKVVDPQDLEALSVGMTIRKYERLGKADMFGRLRRKLRLRYGERGNRIYVFYSSGLLKEFLEPLLVWVEITPTLTDIDRAKRVFERCIEHMDYAVYVNAAMTREAIVKELAYRFRVDRVSVVLVFGRSRPIVDKIRKAIVLFQESEAVHEVERLTYDVKEEAFKVGDIEALTAMISLRKGQN